MGMLIKEYLKKFGEISNTNVSNLMKKTGIKLKRYLTKKPLMVNFVIITLRSIKYMIIRHNQIYKNKNKNKYLFIF